MINWDSEKMTKLIKFRRHFFYREDIDGNFKWKEKQIWFLSKYLLWAFFSFQITAASKYSYIMLIKRLNCWYEVNFRLYSTYSKANQFSIHTYLQLNRMHAIFNYEQFNHSICNTHSDHLTFWINIQQWFMNWGLRFGCSIGPNW